jgi:hypothetical protein
MALEWSEPRPPLGGESSYYDHVICYTSLGPLVIEWKSWKEYENSFWCETPWGDFVIGHTLDEAKANIEKSLEGLVKRLLEELG